MTVCALNTVQGVGESAGERGAGEGAGGGPGHVQLLPPPGARPLLGQEHGPRHGAGEVTWVKCLS